MAHINIKPLDRNQTYERAGDAIMHLFIHGRYAKTWEGLHFGRDLALIRKIDSAIKDKDASKFIASKRKGYWRVELAA